MTYPQGARRRQARRRTLGSWLLAGTIAIAVPAAAPADPGNGNGGPPAGPHAQPPGHANGHAHAQSRGNAHGHERGTRSHGNGDAGGNNGVRAHGNPPAPRGNGNATRSHGSPAAPQSRGGKALGRGNAHQKTTICHSTNSDTNPFVEITVSNRALDAHGRHHDGRDIIPAPGGGCPGEAASNGTGLDTLGAAVEQVIAELAPEASGGGDQQVAGVTEQNADAEPGARVLGAVEERDSAPAAAAGPAAAAAGDDEADDGSLPFTGLELALLAAAGIALLLAGVAGRRVLANRA